MALGAGEGDGARRPRRGLGADFPVRAAAGLALAAGALVIAWLGGLAFLIFWFAAGIGVVWEWQRLIGAERVWRRVSLGAATLLLAAPFAFQARGALAGLILIAGAAATGSAAPAGRRLEAGAGVLYAGVMAVGIVLLRASPAYGFASALWLFAVVWGTDVGAYVGGRLIGGAKLWPAVSPGKTWSGAVAGAATSALLGVLITALAAPRPLHALPMIGLGLVVSVAAQAGDLFESALKRRAGVKDSSHLIPGHGGLMDRLDGFIVAVAMATALGYAHSEGSWIASGLFVW